MAMQVPALTYGAIGSGVHGSTETMTLTVVCGRVDESYNVFIERQAKVPVKL